MTEFLNQRISRSAKEEDSFYKPTYDYLVNKAISLNKKDDITLWLEAANGIISTTSLDYLISPLKDTETKKTLAKLPGELRDTDLINTVRERNIGEYIGLPYKFTVNVFNGDSVLRRDLEVREEVDKFMQQALINMLNEYYNNTDVNTGVPSKEVPDIEKFAKKKIEEWIDKRAIDGFNILKLINAINDFDTKRIQAFFYWWATEEFYTYREIINNEVYTSVLSPLEGYPIYNNEQFVEDYTGFVIKQRTTLTKVKELYWKDFSNTEKEYIKNLVRRTDGTFSTKGTWLISRNWDASQNSQFVSNNNAEFDVTDNSESLDEYTIIWRTEVPVKIRRFTDPLGINREEVVPEDYTQNEFDTEIITEWIEEVYIGKRFGNAVSGIYLKPKPCDVQRYDKHTLAPKLPVGGKKGILRNILQNPIPKRLIPYVVIDRMILLQQERTIAKYQGYIQVIPQSLLNSDSTGSKQEKMFYIKADNTLVYDDTSVDFNTVAQGFRIVNMPDIASYLKTLIELRDKYKEEGLEIANMNNYALGDMMASTGKGVMQEGIYRARIGNVLAITMFHAALERDHLADLEFSKIAYQDEKRGSYIDKTTGKPIYIDINLEQHRESDYGVTVENSKIDQDKIDQFKALGFNAGQNGDTESAAAAIMYDSIPELRQAIKEISEANRKFEETMKANEIAAQKYVADAQTARQDSINETAKYVADKRKESAVEVASIRLNDNDNDIDSNITNVDNEDKIALERDKLEAKTNDSNIKNRLKEKQIASTERLARERLTATKNKQNSKK